MQNEKCKIEELIKADVFKLFAKGEYRNFAFCILQFAFMLVVVGGLT